MPREVQVWTGADDQGVDGHVVLVADGASLQEIVAQVAQECGVPHSSVKAFVDGKRAQQLQQVPGAQQAVTAAVRTDAEQVAVRKLAEECTIPPKPVVMHQDMDGLSVVVALDEVIDNSIRANATHISLGLLQDANCAVVGLVCKDDGDGMCREMAVNHMRLAHTDSGLVYAPRQPNLPLAAALYHSTQLSRHGKGAAALLHFGDEVETETKTREVEETVKVTLNYRDWNEEFKREGTCTYKVLVEEFFSFLDEADDEDTEQRAHYTAITIKQLHRDMAGKLANRVQREQWAQQISDHYHFFVHGFPEQLWATLPADLLQSSLQQGVRPAGGLTIDLFGIPLSQQQALPAQVPRPRLATILDRFRELSEEFGQDRDGQPKLAPFWLPIRWVEPGMRPEQVPDNVTNDRDNLRGGPAGKLRGVHRDFLMLLMYFPFQDGRRTKPELAGGSGVEDLMFTAWCGRMIPKAFKPTLPPLVAQAQQSSKDVDAWKLTPHRLCSVLFCSPEVYTSNHKTELMDEAFDAVTDRLGSIGRAESGRHDLWVWDAEQHKWCESALSSKLLSRHHQKHWVSLESDGELIDVQVVGTEVRYSAFKPPGSSTPIKAGDLVRLTNAAADAEAAGPAGSSQAGSSGQRRRSAGQSGRPASAGADNAKTPIHHRIVEHFVQSTTHGDGRRIEASLREWVPSWVPGGGGRIESVPAAFITQVQPAAAKKLQQGWEAGAPKQLAWFEAGAGSGRKKDRVTRDIHQLQGVSSSQQLTVAQVPPTLTVCFATDRDELVQLSTVDKWSSSLYLGAEAVAVRWELLRDEAPGARNPKYLCVSGGKQTVRYTTAHKCVIDKLSALAQEAGDYWLRVTTQCPWVVNNSLEYRFKVVGHQAATLVASWPGRGAQDPEVRLEEELPALEIRADDSNGQAAVLPFSSDSEAAAAITVQVRAGDATLICTGPQADDVSVSQDRQLIKLKGCRLEMQQLRLVNNMPLQAHLVLKMATPDRDAPLELSAQHAPRLTVLSGPPSKLKAINAHNEHSEADPYSGNAVSRGSIFHNFLNLKLMMLDECDNPYIEQHTGGGKEYCARIRFEPPGAAERTRSASGEALSLMSTNTRRKSGAAAAAEALAAGGAAAAGAAAAAAARPDTWPIKVDGNIVELGEDDFRWRAPPGAGPVCIIMQVFKGRQPRADTAPLLEHRGYYRMQRMHTAVEHPSVEEFHAAARWEKWKAKERPDWDPVTGFILNTGDFPITVEDKTVQLAIHCDVQADVLVRFCEAYEPRLDVVGGQLLWSFVSPSGRLIRSQKPSDRSQVKSKVPFFLAAEWNSCASQRQLVYEVALLVDSGVVQQQQSLSGLVMRLCNEEDREDQDFCGRCKLCLEGPDGPTLPVFPNETRLDIAGGVLQLPPISLQPAWFTAANRGTATLVLLDAEPFAGADPTAAGSSSGAQAWQWLTQPQQELGRLHLRLSSAAEQLWVMAAGQLFEGVVVSGVSVQQGPGSKGRGRQQQQQGDNLTLVKQHSPAAAGPSSSRAAAAAAQQPGAWAAWQCSLPASRQDPPDSVTGAIDPRTLQLQGRLRLQLGQVATLHFVATDFAGCPAVLSKEQREQVVFRGLQLQATDDAAGALNVEVLCWKWARGRSGASAPADAAGHLGGPFVNSVAFKLTRGHGRGLLRLQLTGSFGHVTELQVRVRMDAGPVAVDGLRLCQAEVTQFGAAATTTRSCSVLGFLDTSSWQLLRVPEEAEVRVKQEPAAAAAAGLLGPAGVEPEQQQQDEDMQEQQDEDMQEQQDEQPQEQPQDDEESQLLQAQQQDEQDEQQHEEQEQEQQDEEQEQPAVSEGDKGNPIVVTDSSEEEDGEQEGGGGDAMDVDEQPQQEQQQPQQPQQLLSARQRWVAGRSPSTTALLTELAGRDAVVEGSTVSLQLQLYDCNGNEITADKDGKLQLLRLRNCGSSFLQHLSADKPEQHDEQQHQEHSPELQQEQKPPLLPLQLPAPDWEVLAEPVAIHTGSATFQLQLAVGDSWCGDQLFMVRPDAPEGSEVGAALPVLLWVQVVPGPFTSRVLQIRDLVVGHAAADPAAAAALGSPACAVAAVEALQALYGGGHSADSLLQQLSSVLDVAAADVSSLQDLAAREALLLQLPASNSTGQAAAVLLPQMTIKVVSRDGSVLLPQSLQPLHVELQQWLPPAAAAAGGGQWVRVQAGPWTLQAEQQEAQLEADDQQEQQQQQLQTVFELPLACRQLPTQAGVYRLTDVYAQQEPPGIGDIKETIGPFVLLPGAPHSLALTAGTGQQQQQQAAAQTRTGGKGRQASKGRGKGRGSAAGGRGAASASAAPAEAVVAPTDQVVALEDVGRVSTAQQTLQLKDCWGNTWRPAAAQLAAQLNAASPASSAAAAADAAEGATAAAAPDAAAAAPDAAAASGAGAGSQEDLYVGFTPEQKAALFQLADDAAAEPPSKRQRTEPSAAAAAGGGRGDDGGGSSAAAAAAAGAAAGAAAQWWLRLWLVPKPASAPEAGGGSSHSAPPTGSPPAQLVRQQLFDADGCCGVQPTTLAALGISSTGEWQLWGEAAPGPARSTTSSSSMFNAAATNSSGQQLLQVLLASWHVAPQGAQTLAKRIRDVRTAHKALRDAVAKAKVAERQAHEQLAAKQRQLEVEVSVAAQHRRNLNTRQQTFQEVQHLVPLQQQAAQLAAQRQLLPATAQRQLLEHPWIVRQQQQQQQQQQPYQQQQQQQRQTRQQQQPPQVLYQQMTQQEVQLRILPEPLARLHLQRLTVLGPVVTLASVECRDVARVLSALLVQELGTVIALDNTESRAILESTGGRSYINLAQPELLCRYAVQVQVPHAQLIAGEQWCTAHPQMPLPPSLRIRQTLSGLLDWTRYDPDTGFIGFGHNLLFLNEHLLGQAVHIQAVPDGRGQQWVPRNDYRSQLNLRQTLWNWKLGNVLVFEREANIARLRHQARQHNKALNGLACLALDGATYGLKLGHEGHRLHMPVDGAVCFGPAGPAAAANPLDLRLRLYKERQDQLAEQQRLVDQQAEALRQQEQQVQQLEQQVQQLEQRSRAVDAAAQQEGARLAAEEVQLHEELDRFGK